MTPAISYQQNVVFCRYIGSPNIIQRCLSKNGLEMCNSPITLWLFNIAMEAMVHRNRWFTVVKNGGSFHGYVKSIITFVAFGSLGILASARFWIPKKPFQQDDQWANSASKIARTPATREGSIQWDHRKARLTTSWR